MKKLIITSAALALIAGSVQATDVFSQNVVGYQKLDTLGTGYTMLAINFEAIGGGEISIQDYFQGEFMSGSAATSDNLLVWTPTGYNTYYLWDGDELWYDADDDALPTEDTYPAGTAVWLLRRGAASPVTVMGEVAEDPAQISLVADGYTMFSNAYPVDIEVNGGLDVDGPTSGSAATADNLLVWTSTGYVTYYLWDGDDLWYDADDDALPTEDVIPTGAGAWYLRRGPATTLDLVSPLN